MNDFLSKELEKGQCDEKEVFFLPLLRLQIQLNNVSIASAHVIYLPRILYKQGIEAIENRWEMCIKLKVDYVQ